MPSTAFMSPLFSLGWRVRLTDGAYGVPLLRPKFFSYLCGRRRIPGRGPPTLSASGSPRLSADLPEGTEKSGAEGGGGEAPLPARASRLAHASRQRRVLKEPDEPLQHALGIRGIHEVAGGPVFDELGGRARCSHARATGAHRLEEDEPEAFLG